MDVAAKGLVPRLREYGPSHADLLATDSSARVVDGILEIKVDLSGSLRERNKRGPFLRDAGELRDAIAQMTSLEIQDTRIAERLSDVLRRADCRVEACVLVIDLEGLYAFRGKCDADPSKVTFRVARYLGATES